MFVRVVPFKAAERPCQRSGVKWDTSGNHRAGGAAMKIESAIPAVGDYQLLQDFECAAASVRVFAMPFGTGAVGGHVHRRSMQIYVALEGAVAIDVDGVERTLLPYEALAVWPGSLHRASPVDADVVLLNISIPPLAADDQLAATAEREHGDMRLPRAGDDLED